MSFLHEVRKMESFIAEELGPSVTRAIIKIVRDGLKAQRRKVLNDLIRFQTSDLKIGFVKVFTIMAPGPNIADFVSCIVGKEVRTFLDVDIPKDLDVEKIVPGIVQDVFPKICDKLIVEEFSGVKIARGLSGFPERFYRIYYDEEVAKAGSRVNGMILIN